ncbi:MAG: diacylglycerol kinase family lipid kinase [Paludibacter sp.]|jgi:diacylglycerol kinase (ATP)|nr:diacylglycerol kinase family lipid kinase [Paludibacter sp.]
MEITHNRWAIIINPKSGKKKFRKQRKYLFETLKHNGVEFDYRVTRFAGHASKIASAFVEQGYKNIMILGGDGTTSEVINGIFSANIEKTDDLKIALIPRGTGNDWGRFWGLTADYKKSTEIFLKGKTQLIDVGKVEYDMEGKMEAHYFINSIGLGLDAAVVNLTHRLKEIVGSHSFLYSVALLMAVFSYRPHKLKIHSEEKTLSHGMFTMNIANGCYSGGGLKQNPYALPYDGLLDVMIARTPRFTDIVGALLYLFRGKLLEHPVIESFRTRELLIQCDKNALMEADGIIVHGFSPFRVKILPNAIHMIVP